MKVIYFSHCELLEGMASTVHVREVASNLRSSGAEVLVICKKHEAARLSGQELPVPFIPLKGLRTASFTLLANLKLFLLCRERRPDAVYCRRMLLDPLPALVARLLGIPLILELNEVLEPHARELRPVFFWRKVMRLIEAALMSAAAAVICPSETMRAHYAAKYPGKAAVFRKVYHGANLENFLPEDRAASQKRLGLDPGVYVLWAGTSFWWSGIDFIGGLSRELERRGAGVRILVLGGGAEVERLKVTAGSAVVFRPPLPYSEMRFAYSAASALLAPYSPEYMDVRGVPFKVVESLACGTPVIMNVSPVALEAGSSLPGVLFPSGASAAAWADLIAGAASDPEKSALPGRQGREGLLKAGMTWAFAAREIRRIIEEASS